MRSVTVKWSEQHLSSRLQVLPCRNPPKQAFFNVKATKSSADALAVLSCSWGSGRQLEGRSWAPKRSKPKLRRIKALPQQHASLNTEGIFASMYHVLVAQGSLQAHLPWITSNINLGIDLIIREKLISTTSAKAVIRLIKWECATVGGRGVCSLFGLWYFLSLASLWQWHICTTRPEDYYRKPLLHGAARFCSGRHSAVTAFK